MQQKVRTDDDDGTARVIDALAEKVLTEAARLALEHVGHGLQRTIARASHWAAMAAVVEQGVHSFLQHALFVADDDIRRAKLKQVLETIVAVDDATIEIVQVGGRKAAAFKRNERAKVWRDDRQHFEDHPFWTAVAFGEALAELEALGELLADLLGARLGHRLFEFLGHIRQVELGEDVTDGLGTHADAEGVCTVLLFGFTKIDFGQELTALKRGAAWIDDHVVFVIDHAL